MGARARLIAGSNEPHKKHKSDKAVMLFIAVITTCDIATRAASARRWGVAVGVAFGLVTIAPPRAAVSFEE